MVWKHLVHPNIVPLLGTTTAPLQFVSDWMSGGNLKEYIEAHTYPCTNRQELVRDYPTTLGDTLIRSPAI